MKILIQAPEVVVLSFVLIPLKYYFSGTQNKLPALRGRTFPGRNVLRPYKSVRLVLLPYFSKVI